MWQGQFNSTTDVSAEKLYRAVQDIARWPQWDVGLEATEINGAPATGVEFTLKPKGGPRVRMSIDELAPYRLVDTAHLFGAKMTTVHEYRELAGETRIHMSVSVRGPLSFFWRKIVAENQIKDAPAQTAAFIAHARQLA
ncbi:polyketide cyclase [Permianibacter sp. IMCC34836]|uniref:SRPBCC family protein n=1 Tax=Permianibacter fluminis TaxID=2738515 RepID=UPI001553DFF7|nr:SRPBCC family protein [Permianibacter fluminis]NQD36223.1 polyketide cyclase [Permianibacter fluminis]